MNLAKNLQTLRKSHNISQEELANELGISRQAVSKWESGEAYPEIENIVALCDYFSCDIDSLVRGNVVNSRPKTNHIFTADNYDRFMSISVRHRALGLAIILLGISLMLTFLGLMPVNDLNDTIGAIIFLVSIILAIPLLMISNTKLRIFRQQNPVLNNLYSEDSVTKNKLKYTKLFTISVTIILLGVLAILILSGINPAYLNDNLRVAILMYFIAIGEPIAFYASKMSTKYNLEKYNAQNTPEYLATIRKVSKINGAVFIGATIIFLIWGFVANSWTQNWIVYLVAVLACVIVNIIFGRGRRLH